MKRECSKSKKAQVTIFVIIAVVIVAAVAGYFILRGGIGTERVSAAFTPVKTAVEGCLEKSLNEAIFYNALQGGYYNVPTPNVEYILTPIPVYLNRGTSLVPSKAVVEAQLALSIENNIDFCLGNFEALQNQGYNISAGSRTIKITINDETVDAAMTWPLAVSKAGEKQRITSFSAKSNFDLMTKYNLASDIVDKQKEDVNVVPISYIVNLAADNGFRIETIELDGNNTLYTLIFPEKLNEQEFIYAFDIKY